MSSEPHKELLSTLKARFEQNMNRHQGIEWAQVQTKLEANPEKLCSLHEMEKTGCEPDVVGFDEKTGEYIFYDCSLKVPKAAEVYVMTRKHLPPGNNINRQTARSIWQPPWASRF